MSDISLAQGVDIALELLGKDGGVVVAESNASANLRWANSSLTTNGDMHERTLSIAAFVNHGDGVGTGLSSGQIRTRTDIAELVSRAQAAGRAGGKSEDAQQLTSGSVDDNFYSDPVSVDLNEFESLASGLGETFGHPDAQFFGYAEQSADTSYVGTSAGTRFRFVQNTSRFELCAKSFERDRSSWSGQCGTHMKSVNVGQHAAQVIEGLEFQRNKIDIEPGLHTVTLSPSAMADLMIYLMWTASAREASEGRSVFSSAGGGTRIGERLSPRDFSVSADPHARDLETLDHVVSVGTSSFTSTFDTGLPIGRSDIIHNGVLTALGSSRHTAREAQLPFTPLADNIVVSDGAGHGTLQETAARMGDGLLITCLWYIREVDPQSLLLTGLTRDGVYVVRGGEIVGAANNFRFNESPVGMLNRIVDAGEAINCLPREWADWFPRARVAPVTIDGFNLSTRSDAI